MSSEDLVRYLYKQTEAISSQQFDKFENSSGGDRLGNFILARYEFKRLLLIERQERRLLVFVDLRKFFRFQAAHKNKDQISSALSESSSHALIPP